MNAFVVYVVVGGLAASIVLSLAMGRLLRRLRLDREATGERPDPPEYSDLPELTREDADRLWAELALAAPLTSADLDRILGSFEPCGAAGPCRLHEPVTCRTAGACCPTCPTAQPIKES